MKSGAPSRELYAIDLLPIKLIDVAFTYNEPLGLSRELNFTLKSHGPLHGATHAMAALKRLACRAHMSTKSPPGSEPIGSSLAHKEVVPREFSGITNMSMEIMQGGLV